MHRVAAFCLAAACLVAAGCAPLQLGTSADENPAVPQRYDSSTPVTDGPAAQEMVEIALQIASKHLSVPASELEVLRIDAVDWRDSSLGCPDPGMEYMQVITPGHLALVSYKGGPVHRVHMARGRGFVCESSPEKLAAKGPVPLPTFSQSQLEALARADLAHRLGAKPSEGSVVRTRAVEWPDATLGCGITEVSSAGGATKGFVITLSRRNREYEYHTDLRTAIPCPPVEKQ